MTGDRWPRPGPVASSRPAGSDPRWHPSWRAVPCSFPVRCACPGPWAGPLPSDLSRGQTRRSPRLRLGPGGQAGPQRGANPALAAPAWKQPEARPAPAPVRGRSFCPVWDARGCGVPWGRPRALNGDRDSPLGWLTAGPVLLLPLGLADRSSLSRFGAPAGESEWGRGGLGGSSCERRLGDGVGDLSGCGILGAPSPIHWWLNGLSVAHF